jgi:hypothetical protein
MDCRYPGGRDIAPRFSYDAKHQGSVRMTDVATMMVMPRNFATERRADFSVRDKVVFRPEISRGATDERRRIGRDQQLGLA